MSIGSLFQSKQPPTVGRRGAEHRLAIGAVDPCQLVGGVERVHRLVAFSSLRLRRQKWAVRFQQQALERNRQEALKRREAKRKRELQEGTASAGGAHWRGRVITRPSSTIAHLAMPVGMAMAGSTAPMLVPTT